MDNNGMITIMQTIDRFYRFVSFSRRKVLIVLLAVSGSFLTFNYAALSENFLSRTRQHQHRKEFSRVVVVSVMNYGETNRLGESGHNETSLLRTLESHHREKVAKVGSQRVTSQIEKRIIVKPSPAEDIILSSVSSVTDDYGYTPAATTSIYNTESTGNSTSIPIESNWNDEYSSFNYDYESLIGGTESTGDFLNNFYSFLCKNVTLRRSRKRKKNLIVYENFISGTRSTACHESITYTTHGDYRYLGNLIPLVERWNGPVSVALYSPGDDLHPTLKFISFLRDCTSSKISEFVTFHIFFEVTHSEIPAQPELQFTWLDSLYTKEQWKDCSVKPRLQDYEPTFRIRKRLLYPVNIARNIARNAAATHYVLASDIELYPSVNLILPFFRMLKEESSKDMKAILGFPTSNHASPKVYVLPIFEVKQGLRPPRTKEELVSLLNTHEAVPFHNYICRECHLIPQYEKWKMMKIKTLEGDDESLHVFYTAKRKPPFQLWEPIYIGTKYEPPYDERLSWEGLRDKMTQGYILCALDYDFLILDNAFLVHKPGIKRLTRKVTKTVLRQDRLIDLRIKSELYRRFGRQQGCTL